MNSKVRHIIYGIISFVLSFVLFLLSFAIVLQSTILNPSYIMDNMNTSNYFVDKRDEIKESLVDLGYASGLDEKFFENVVDEVTIHDNTQAYLNSFYAGVLVAILCVIIIFTNRWKHRAVRYICYSTSAAFLTVGIIPAVLLSTGYMSKINIDSRAFYNLFVQSMNNILIALAICSVIFFIVSIGLFFLHKSMRRRASED